MRALAAAELRSISLSPGPEQIWDGGTLGLSAVVAVVCASAGNPLWALGAVGAGAAVAANGYRKWRRRRIARVEDAAMVISPWGIVADSPRGRRRITWAEVQSVRTRRITTDGGAFRSRRDETIQIRVEIGLADATFVGVIAYDEPAVTFLESRIIAYAEEAARAIALDLEATRNVPAPDSTAPSLAEAGVFEAVHQAARGLMESPEGAELLGLSWSGYRSGVSAVAGPETVKKLEALLEACAGQPDRAPLVAILAAELGARELAPALLTLIMSPNAFVAAACKAAALRLGEAPFRSGPIREVAPFLPEAELSAIERWSRAGEAK